MNERRSEAGRVWRGGKGNVILAWWLVTYIGAECAARCLSETNITALSA
jgi:hypothetical protein